MINLSFESVLILLIFSFVVGIIAGISLTKPVLPYWNESKKPHDDNLLEEENKAESRLPGDSTTNAPPPDVRKKKKKGK